MHDSDCAVCLTGSGCPKDRRHSADRQAPETVDPPPRSSHVQLHVRLEAGGDELQCQDRLKNPQNNRLKIPQLGRFHAPHQGTGSRRIFHLLLFVLGSFRTEEPGFLFFLDAIAFALDIDRGRMVQQSIQNRRRQDRIAKDLAPCAIRFVGR